MMRSSSKPTLLALLLLPFTGCSCEGEPGLVRENGKLEASPAELDFGEVEVGTEAVRALSLKNLGDHALLLEAARLSDQTSFHVAQRAPDSLGPSGQASMALSFTPGAEGAQSATLYLDNDGLEPSVAVQLRGKGVLPTTPPPVCGLGIGPQALDFSGTPLGGSRELAVTLANVSSVSCTFGQVRVEGAAAAQFSLPDPVSGAIAAGMSQGLRVRLQRQDRAALSATLIVETQDPAQPQVGIPLSAAELPVDPPMPGLCVVPTAVQFGRVMGSAMRGVTLTACGDHDVTITALDWTTANGELSLASPPLLPFTLARGLSQVVNVRYQPRDQTDDRAVLTVRSDDPLVPSVDVEVTGSNDIVPPVAGRYLYYWQVNGAAPFQTSDVMRLPLQGAATPAAYWGQSTGRPGCPGCHHASPDGRYVAVVEYGLFGPRIAVVDTTSNTSSPLPIEVVGGASFSWRPDIGGSPAYRYVVGAGGRLHLGSLTSGYLGELPGASAAGSAQAMPSWGANGQIVFVSGSNDASHDGFGFNGATDLMLIPEAGGTALPVPGASGNGMGNYYPAFSPNGLWISFTQSAAAASTYSAPDAQVRLVRADRSGTVEPLSMLNGTRGATSYPTWSIDGTFLSFSSNRPGGAGDWDIYLAPIDPTSGVAGTPANLTDANTASFEHGAEWSP